MAEYIEREALLERAENRKLIFEESVPVEEAIAEQVSVFLEEIEAAPAADVVEVVRCGECKKIMTTDCMLCTFSHDGYCTGGPNEDFYCADGERRETWPNTSREKCSSPY